MRLLVKNGTVVDPSGPSGGLMAVRDLLMDNGVVMDAGPRLAVPDNTVIWDASGLLVCPGFIDMHVHLREPGREDEETIATGTRAAAAGGFTAVVAMPNTSPVADNQAVLEFVRSRAEQEGAVRVYPVGCITRGQAGEELADMGELVRSGAVGVSDDGKPVANARLMRHALEYSLMFDIPVMAHAEEPTLSEGEMHEGAMSTILGLRGISRLAEEIMVARDLLLAEETGARLHICHVSTRRSVDLIRQAKAKGVRVTAEATPHHFTLTDEAVSGWDTSTKVNPPLRTQDDREAIREGLADGTIDAIATDHAPHSLEEKDVEYPLAPNGLVGLETAVPLAMTHLVSGGYLTMRQMVERFSLGPAAALGFPVPTFALGSPANVTVIDPSVEKVVDPLSFHSKSHNTPFAGMKLRGWPVLTVVDGQVVFDGRKASVRDPYRHFPQAEDHSQIDAINATVAR